MSLLKPKDLSKVDFLTGNNTLQNTANCYVVTKPGTYKIPLVYGNAIKNGETNHSALLGFKNYRNIEINTPQIDANIIHHCKIIYKDNVDVRHVRINFTNSYIYFTIGRLSGSTYNSGSALIGIYDKLNSMIWSWVIWYTEENLSTIPIKFPKKYKSSILSVPLLFGGSYFEYVWGYSSPSPYYPYKSEGNPQSTWGTGFNNLYKNKHINDPCPPGFKISGLEIFSRIIKSAKIKDISLYPNKNRYLVVSFLIQNSEFKLLTRNINTPDKIVAVGPWSCYYCKSTNDQILTTRYYYQIDNSNELFLLDSQFLDIPSWSARIIIPCTE